MMIVAQINSEAMSTHHGSCILFSWE